MAIGNPSIRTPRGHQECTTDAPTNNFALPWKPLLAAAATTAATATAAVLGLAAQSAITINPTSAVPPRARRLSVLKQNCNGTQQEMRACGLLPCGLTHLPRDCQWDSWTPWYNNCSCASPQTRSRDIRRQADIGGKPCSGPRTQVRVCKTPCPSTDPVDCVLSPWTPWSKCTKSCQGGQQFHTREIVTQPQYGGAACRGDLQETRVCNWQDCPGHVRIDCRWADWGHWSTCSSTCGGGEMRRARSIQVAPQHGGTLCAPLTGSEVAACARFSCNSSRFDCVWSSWAVWSPCTKSCGGGLRYRVRSIAREALTGGMGCTGVFEDYSFCNQAPCLNPGQDCVLSQWSTWSICSATCNGHRSRNRNVAVQAHDGGLPCNGDTMQLDSCNVHAPRCIQDDADCLHGDWNQWGECSRSCSGGSSIRVRDILRHALGKGAQCNGSLQEVRLCNSLACPGKSQVDCRWSVWSEWSDCTTSCGGGQFRRHRNVARDAANNGRSCKNGASVQVGRCNTQPCVKKTLVCDWDDWGQWSECQRGPVSVFCGGGQQKRSRAMRAVQRSLPVLTGTSVQSRRLEPNNNACNEVQDQLQACAQVQCQAPLPKDCRWSSWSDWSSCPCSGMKERHRVISLFASGGGAPCRGPEVEAAPCRADCDAQASVDCVYSSWTEWSACPVTCGGGHGDNGFLTRYRSIVQYATGSGKPCQGSWRDRHPCNMDPCPNPVDCKWDTWSAYSSCSVTCGGGQKSRTRNIKQVAKNGGQPCNRTESMVVTACNTQVCPTNARDCEFSGWNEWQPCSAPCGGGHQHRTRIVMVDATRNGASCEGGLQEFRPCGTAPCEQKTPIPCDWGGWSDWSACSRLCNGHQERSRAIAQFAKNGGAACEGSERDARACNLDTQVCADEAPRDCVLSQWTGWSNCSQSCDGGQHFRSRDIDVTARNNGKPCIGSLRQSAQCNLQSCPSDQIIDCQWGKWGDWSDCSRSCGGGQRSRHRSIDVEPSARGLPCDTQAAMATAPCNVGSCYGVFQVCGWSDWQPWDHCSASCGGGQQQRMRQKQWVPAADTPQRRLGISVPRNGPDNHECVGSQKAIRPCAIAACDNGPVPLPCRWADWSTWGACSCEGLQERDRGIVQRARDGGLVCEGPMQQTKRCKPNCAAESVDCTLSAWTTWSQCTRTCGGGQRYHQRSISKHAMAHGSGCHGSLEEVVDCMTQPCHHPIDCRLTDWVSWSECTRSCGGGTHIRNRRISNRALFGGKPCPEVALEEMSACQTAPCQPPNAVSCKWTVWSQWADCSVTCGSGRKKRVRLVAQPAAHGGLPCSGLSAEYQRCIAEPCSTKPVDCQFSQWSMWSSCHKQCDGHQERLRNVSTLATTGGALCRGPTLQVLSCSNTATCRNMSTAVDCQLGEWTPWSACSRRCGGGQQVSNRQVVRHSRGKGAPCNAALRRVHPCNLQTCSQDKPVDCVWGAWSAFSKCTAQCDGGEMQRSRSITTEAKNGGKPCDGGAATQVKPCNIQPCSGHQICTWSQWSDWKGCTATCGGGEKQRNRSLIITTTGQQHNQNLASSKFMEDMGVPQPGPLDMIIHNHKGQVLALAIVGALSIAAVLLSGAWQAAGRLQLQAPGSSYVALGTHDPSAMTDDDEERPSMLELPTR